MSPLKLRSCDGVIFYVDMDIVKQMVTIKTMIDHENEESDEVTPVPTVRGDILKKIVDWIKFHQTDGDDHTIHTRIAWHKQYFNLELNMIFEIIIASDYLEVESLNY